MMARITTLDNHMKILDIEKRLTYMEYLIASFWIPIIILFVEKIVGA